MGDLKCKSGAGDQGHGDVKGKAGAGDQGHGRCHG